MKRQLFRIVLLVIALATGFWLMSCATGPQNVNQNRTSEEEGITPLASPTPNGLPCDQATIQLKLDKIEEWIMWKVNGDKKLREQYANDEFNFDFVQGTQPPEDRYGFVVVEGAIQGQKRFKRLAEYIEDYVVEGCNLRIIYVPAGTLPLKRTVFTGIGFEWCESPLVACPKGVCAEPPCPTLMNSNTSSNTRPISNKDANTNSPNRNN